MRITSFHSSIIKELKKSSTIRSFLAILSGQAAVQILSILATLILSRIYKPESFAALAVTIALTGIFIPLITGSLDNAIILELKQEKAERLLVTSFYFILFMSAALTVVGSLISYARLDIEIANFNINILIVAISSLSAFSVICQSMLLKMHRFTDVNKLIAVPVLLNPIVAFLLWSLGYNNKGLIIAFFVSCAIQAAYSLLFFLNILKKKLPLINLLKILYKHKSYPLYVSTTSALDSITGSLPVILGSFGQTAIIIGNYSLMLKLFVFPLSLISASISKSYFSHSAAKFDSSASEFFEYTIKILSILSVIGIFYVLGVSYLVFPLARNFMSLAWDSSFLIFQILLPSIFFKFVASTLSSCLLTINAKKFLVGWKIFAFLTTFIALYFALDSGYIIYFRALMINDLCLYFGLLIIVLIKCRPAQAKFSA